MADEKPTTAKYDIHNPTPAPRVIYDAAHQPVHIPAGGTVHDIELEDKIADEYKKRTKKKEDADIVLSDPGSAEDREDDDADNAADNEGKGEQEVELTENQKAARALIDKANTMEFNGWKDKVKHVLGDDWPGGKPRKKDLIKLLKKVK